MYESIGGVKKCVPADEVSCLGSRIARVVCRTGGKWRRVSYYMRKWIDQRACTDTKGGRWQGRTITASVRRHLE
jgi:hypothetical protein